MKASGVYVRDRWDITFQDREDYYLLGVELKRVIYPQDIGEVVEDVAAVLNIYATLERKPVVVAGKMPCFLACSLTSYLSNVFPEVYYHDKKLGLTVRVAGGKPGKLIGVKP